MASADAPALGATAAPPARLGWCASAGGVDLALRLTCLTLLLRPVGTPAVRPWTLVLAGLGLVVPGCLRHPLLWAALTALTGTRVALDWSLADNHAYLLAYWCFAITLALSARDVAGCLALNGRLLIGWAFAFAMLWKLVLAPDYLDGRFFRVTLLTDTRFTELAQLAGGLDADEHATLRDFVLGHAPPATRPHEPARFVRVARLVTLGTVALEGMIAIAWLWPFGRGPSKLRDALLLIFCATTYAVATVAAFGWLLVGMGVAQCEPERRGTRLAYLAVFGVILAYREMPLMEWALSGVVTIR